MQKYTFSLLATISANTKDHEGDTEEESKEDCEDAEYQPEVMIDDDNQPMEETLFSGAMDALHGTPLKFQVERKFLGTLSADTKNKIKQKYKRSKLLFKEQFAAAIAPGQESDILKMVSSSSDSEEDTNMDNLVKLYHASEVT